VEGVSNLLVTANVVPSSLILSALIMEAIRHSETPVFTEATRPTSQKKAFFSHRHENLKSYIEFTGRAL
jgi:hypothetical protein